ncbi:hypothetical protein CLAFUW4_06496 [Fulvia fulva]|nr:hypothetical protein CLAFUR0_06501 [Fulvia fulva]WPV15743.1 hypothetical protein CLAFUW4_06496 [Fulvia fulva]WPV31286.1 hypothetical protein CLAFUW7_06496 [Fulvia fulva]
MASTLHRSTYKADALERGVHHFDTFKALGAYYAGHSRGRFLPGIEQTCVLWPLE